MKRNLGFFALALSVVLCFGVSAFGQQVTGEIQGTVRDPNGAVVPNVTVNIQGVNIGFKRTVQADADGVYHAREVPRREVPEPPRAGRGRDVRPRVRGEARA